MALTNERETIRDDVEPGGNQNREAWAGPGNGPEPMTQRAVAGVRRRLRRLELGAGVSEDDVLDPARRVVVKGQMTRREERQRQAGRKGRERNPRAHTNTGRSDHLKPLYGDLLGSSSHPPAVTVF